jgi:hypothetical protein
VVEQVTVVAAEPDQGAVDEVVLAEALEAHAFFSERGGHASEWYFVNRWRRSRPLPRAEGRAESLARLYADGRIVPFEYQDTKGRATRGIQPPPADPEAVG